MAKQEKQEKQEKPEKQGFTDAELKGTWMAQVKCNFPIDNFHQLLKQEHYNKDAKVFKGETFEKDPHITVGMKLKVPSTQLTKVINELCPFTTDVLQVNRWEKLNMQFDDGTIHNYNVIFLELDKKKLQQVHKLIMDDSGEEWKHADYTAHMTLFYTDPLDTKTWLQYKKQIEDLLQVLRASMPVTEIIFKKFRERDMEPRRIKLLGKENKVYKIIHKFGITTLCFLLLAVFIAAVTDFKHVNKFHFFH